MPSVTKCLFYKKWKDTLYLLTSNSVLLQITRFMQSIKKHRKVALMSINCGGENRAHVPQSLPYVHVSKHVVNMF